ncbi:MAG: hypothetical protein MUC81_09480 [Bacteroidia bacterium]|jgi:hypothetical protein|nr:hypothetical protein [Bacteroidia bacterium]
MIQYLKILFLISFSSIVLYSCSGSNNDNTATTTPEPIITNDSSQFNGRLRVELRNQNNNLEANGIVYLYPTFDDLKRNLPLNFQFTNQSGVVDFGFLLQGNYYILGRNSGNPLLADTAIVQVLSRRETYRTLRLSFQ